MPTADRFAHIPIWAIHGADDPTVPAEKLRQMIQVIQEAGGQPGYTEYQGVGHFSWLQTYDDKYIINWLFSQRKGD